MERKIKSITFKQISPILHALQLISLIKSFLHIYQNLFCAIHYTCSPATFPSNLLFPISDQLTFSSLLSAQQHLTF